jgi:methylmalonyl-CoA mutase N-terminal domain/subunit
MNNPAPLLDWERVTLQKALSNSPERLPDFRTASGLPVERLALPETLDNHYLEQLGFPGQYPYTRGVYPTMYRGRLWTFRQYSGFSSAEESNRRYRYLLEQGTTGLSVAFDLPTQMGYDSDNPLCYGEVGKVGVPIDSLADMQTLFKNIPLDQVSTSMTINATAAVILAMYVVAAEKEGIRPETLSGTLQNDILKEYIARGTYVFPALPSLRLTADIVSWCWQHLPRFNTISISGYHIREAGATAIQEVAFTLGNGCAYVEAIQKAGLSVDDFAPRLSFFFSASSDVFEEVAKFRAARRMWARLMKKKFGARKPESQMLRFHAQTSGYTLTAQQPHNNIVRVTLQAMAAVLGGAQSLHTNSLDEALALPTESSVRIALRTQQILAGESGLAHTIDPLGGSYFIEHLTDQIEAEATELLRKIDALGGMVAAIEAGQIQSWIEQSAFEAQQRVETGQTTIVGVNKFQDGNSAATVAATTRPAQSGDQLEKLARIRRDRNQTAVTRALARVKAAAQGNDNLMPAVLEAVRAYATNGEITDALRHVFGSYDPH